MCCLFPQFRNLTCFLSFISVTRDPFFFLYFILNLSITVLDENIYLTYTRRKLGLTMHSQTKLLFHQLGKGFQEFQTISKLVSGRFQLTENGLLDSRFV